MLRDRYEPMHLFALVPALSVVMELVLAQLIEPATPAALTEPWRRWPARWRMMPNDLPPWEVLHQ